MFHNDLVTARQRFTEIYVPLDDDKKVPQFYQLVIDQYQSELATLHADAAQHQHKLAFIVVAHFVHTMPYFLEALSTLGAIAAVICKGSRVVDNVKQSIRQIYQAVLREDANKETFLNPETAKRFLLSVIQNPVWNEYKFIIIDHGGYFASIMHDVPEYLERLTGIVEHTLNGEQKYLTHQPFNLPVFSIAKTPLKEKENIAVAQSIVDAIRGKILSGEGANQAVERLSKITLIGYGNIGSNVAQILFNQLYQPLLLCKSLGIQMQHNIKIPECYIYDTNEAARITAKKKLPYVLVTENKHVALVSADMIILATSSPALTKEELKTLKNKVCIVCATSSDSMMSSDAWSEFVRINPVGSPVAAAASANIMDSVTPHPLGYGAPVITWYKHRTTEKLICLASDGGSVNFLIGSTPHPILHAVLASVYVAAFKLITQMTNDVRLKPIEVKPSDTRDDESVFALWQKHFTSKVYTSVMRFITSPDRRSFLVMSGNGDIDWCNSVSMISRRVATYNSRTKAIRCITILSNNKNVLFGENNQINVLDLETGQFNLVSLPQDESDTLNNAGIINCIEELPDGNIICGFDNGLKIFNLQTKQYIKTLSKDRTTQIGIVSHDKIVCIIKTPENKDVLKLWMTNDNKCTRQFILPGIVTSPLRPLPNGIIPIGMFIKRNFHTILLLDIDMIIKSGETINGGGLRRPDSNAAICDIKAFSDNRIISTYNDGYAYIWDLEARHAYYRVHRDDTIAREFVSLHVISEDAFIMSSFTGISRHVIPRRANTNNPVNLNSPATTLNQTRVPHSSSFFQRPVLAVGNAVQRVSVEIPGLTFQKISGVGHCLFHAVSIYIGQDEKNLRHVVATLMEINLKYFANIILPMGHSIDNYLRNIKAGNECADTIEIEIIMRAINRPIIIIESENTILNSAVLSRGFIGDPIFVYHDHAHYDAFRLKNGANFQTIISVLAQNNASSVTQSRLSQELKP